VTTDFPSATFPSATGERLPWSALPAAVVEAVEARFGSSVASTVTQAQGFSPAVAVRLVMNDGSRLFLKAVGPNPNPEAPEIYRAEQRIAAQLPATVPAPRLLWTYDDGAWVALVFEDIEGTVPVVPWTSDQLPRVLGALTALVDALTPSPVSAPTFQSRMSSGQFHAWRNVAETGPSALDQVAQVAPWAAQHIDGLVALEERWEEAVSGHSLIHGDLRADNILLTPDRVVFVDWPWASVGAPWIDLLLFLPSVSMQGGPDPWDIFDHHRLGRAAPPEAIDAVLASVAGFFVWGACQPPPPGLPTLRPFQRGQGLAAVAWLRHRTRW
jgi:aminoglycoside phosphotransferase (APT) family kinase protein